MVTPVLPMKLLIIHGYKLQKSGKVSLSLKHRLDYAISYLSNHTDISHILVTGGKTHVNVPESYIMENYLLANNIKLPIIKEIRSRNTIQNVQNSKKLMTNLPIDELSVIVGIKMLSRAKRIYKKRWPEIFIKINWLPVTDGYRGLLEPVWKLFS
jgi:uncharacterized SAM-binding protein YcdF (DUF218 family)